MLGLVCFTRPMLPSANTHQGCCINFLWASAAVGGRELHCCPAPRQAPPALSDRGSCSLSTGSSQTFGVGEAPGWVLHNYRLPRAWLSSRVMPGVSAQLPGQLQGTVMEVLQFLLVAWHWHSLPHFSLGSRCHQGSPLLKGLSALLGHSCIMTSSSTTSGTGNTQHQIELVPRNCTEAQAHFRYRKKASEINVVSHLKCIQDRLEVPLNSAQ